MLRRISATELTEWRAYEKVAGPLGAGRDDVLAAMTAYYVVSALGAKSISLSKLLPTWDDAPQEFDWRALRDELKAMADEEA